MILLFDQILNRFVIFRCFLIFKKVHYWKILKILKIDTQEFKKLDHSFIYRRKILKFDMIDSKK